MRPLLTLVRGGEVHAPQRLGVQDVLIVRGQSANVGRVDAAVLEKRNVPLELGVPLMRDGKTVTPPTERFVQV